MEQEEIMANQSKVQVIRVGVILAVFALGFLCGSVTQHRAEAQLALIRK
jgi:hypothetical protein